MKVKATRTQALEVLQGLRTNLANYKGVKLSYAVLKNTKVLEKEEGLVRKLQQADPTPGMDKYEKARIKLCEDMAAKDEEGKAIHTQGRYQIEDQEAFDKKLAALRKKHKAVCDAEDKRRDEFNAFLEEEVGLDLHGISLEILPDDITAESLVPLMLFVQDEEEE